MAFPSVTYSFSNLTTADGPQVSQNFSDLTNALSDGSKDFSMNNGTLAGTFTANGNVIFGSTSSQTITLNGSLSSSLALGANVTYDIGSATLGLRALYLGGTGSFTLKLKASGSMGASYTATFPAAVPASQANLSMDTSGVITAKVAGQQVSSSSGSFSTNSSSFTAVTNLTVTITTTGRPVLLMLQPDGTASAAVFGWQNNGASATPSFGVQWMRGATSLGPVNFLGSGTATAVFTDLVVGPGAMNMIDVTTAGTYTYTLQVKDSGSGGSHNIYVQNIVIVAIEL